MRRFAVSSWSLDGLITGGLPLAELPAQLAAHGIGVLELCHFHLPSTRPEDLEQLRAALAAAGVELYSLLIDAGDLTAPDPERRAADREFIRHWIGVAAELGAQQVRIDAGLQPPTPAVVEQSAQGLAALAREAAGRGLRAITENWHATSQDPAALLEILDRCQGLVGLCADTGNAEASADKYATLAQILPRASSVHFKARTDDAGAYDLGDLRRCIELIDEARFGGVITLIYGGKRDEWAEIERLREALQPLMRER
jgi:sugar phosphate isomerase/epimerase